ncbi:hypothetical protein ACWDFH_25005, partial [Streptomyces kronopolitis]
MRHPAGPPDRSDARAASAPDPAGPPRSGDTARAGIRARTINSSNTEEWDTVQAEVAAGEVD